MTSRTAALAELFADTPEELRRQALTHSSWVEERKHSYGRLAFLGDSVLGLSVAGSLYERFPDSQEGRLAKLRAHVVSRQSCAVVGRRLELGKRLLEHGGSEGDQEELRRLSVNRNVLAALVEACLGALYLQHGFEPIRGPIVAAFTDRIEYALQGHVDFKTELQEELARRGKTVSYAVLEVDGPPHNRTFTCAAVIDEEQLGIGTGASKKDAEQAAARQALEKLGVD